MPSFNDYERLKNLAKILIYIQIACSLIGSIDLLYIRMSLIHLGIALFALTVIFSNNQSLSRTYVVLLFCAILLDLSWFIFTPYDHILSDATSFLFTSVGFWVRLFSSLVWVEMCRLGGVTLVDSDRDAASSQDPGDLRTQFVSQTFIHVDADALGDNNYNPPYNPFAEELRRENENPPLGHNDGVGRSRSSAEIPMPSPGAVRRSLSL